jgi:hypothetical protein
MSYILTSNTPPPIVIHLDSRFGESVQTLSGVPLTTNYIYNLREPVIVPDNMNVLLSLHSATIPYSFYNVRNEVNNRIYFDLNLYSGDIRPIQFIELDEGNYSATSLANALKTKIEAYEISGISLSLRGFSISILYSRETLKYTFTATYTNPTTIGNVNAFEFQFGGVLFYKGNILLGIADGNQLNLPPATPVKSPNCIDINDSIHGLYIRTNLTSKSTLDTEDGHFSNILARIPITTNAGGIIFHHASQTSHMSMIDVPVIQTLGIKLTDDKNQTIDLHSLHFQISLLISFIHKETIRKIPDKYERRIMERFNNDSIFPINNGRKLKIKEETQNDKKK